jgi:integrase
MPRRTHVPKYLLHKSSGQAYTYHRLIATPDHRIYLGKYGSPESRAKYQEILRWIEAAGGNDPPALPRSQTPSLNELALEYDQFAKAKYRATDGSLSKEYGGMWGALGYLLQLHGSRFASEVGPKLLKDLQRWMVSQNYSRSHINHAVSRVKRFFRWASAEERIDPVIYHKLLCVDGLKRGEMGVKEAAKVAPARLESVDAILPFVSPVVGDMMQVQYLCAMRPIETCIMRGCDIDRSGEIWLYTPTTHKTGWAGKTLIKAIPRAAQKLLTPRLALDPQAFIFSPIETQEWKNGRRKRPGRTTKRYTSEANRLARQSERRRDEPKRKSPGERYCTDSYRRAIWYGVKQAAKNDVIVDRFSPNQLRHAIVTFIAERLGQQKAQRYAGHEHLETTAIYTEKNVGEMIDVANQLDRIWASEP